MMKYKIDKWNAVFLAHWIGGISFLKSKTEDLKDIIDYWKDKFHKVMGFIYDKIYGRFENRDIDLYRNMADTLFINGIMCEKNILMLLIRKIKTDIIMINVKKCYNIKRGEYKWEKKEIYIMNNLN